MRRSLTRSSARSYRHRRIRSVVRGTAIRPRLVVHRSLQHISAQLIDDLNGRTMAAAADQQLARLSGTKTDRAAKVGEAIAAQATAKKIDQAIFDRGGHRYHGRVKALAEAARQGGLKF